MRATGALGMELGTVPTWHKRDGRDPWYGVVLAALAVVAAVVSGMAVLQYRPSVTAMPATPSQSSATAARPSVTPTPALTGLALAAGILTSPEGASVLVAGDGSGNDDDEWVAVWARDHLAADATVSYRAWDRANRQYSPAVRAGSTGPTIDVWNASVSSPDMAREPARVTQAWQDADLVLLSYGHRRTPSEVAAQLDAVLDAVRAEDADVPVVVLLQNPDRAATEAVQRAAPQKIQTWASANGLATVDVYSAFMADPTPRNDLVEADGSPTPGGSQLWARTLADALTTP